MKLLAHAQVPCRHGERALETVGCTPTRFEQWRKSETACWGRVIRAQKIVLGKAGSLELPRVVGVPSVIFSEVEGLGGGFRYCELGDPLFDEHGKMRDTARFADLARHVYLTETGEPLPLVDGKREPKSSLLDACRGVGIYLLCNGILGDRSASGGNVLTRAMLAKLPPFDGQKVIYCAGCLLGREKLRAEGIVVRQTPYVIKVS